MPYYYYNDIYSLRYVLLIAAVLLTVIAQARVSSNFRKYSDNCFSCDVYYDLYVDWKDGNKTYNTSVTYTYVKTNGAWYVADFILN